MRVAEVLNQINGEGQIESQRVKLVAVYGPEGSENAQWAKYTPSANFEIHINNPAAMSGLVSGHEYFVDFTPVK